MTATDPRAEPIELEPGVYYGIPIWDYFRIPALSSSQLKTFARSPGAYAHALETPSGSTPATVFGNALHDLTLMGEEYFAQHYPSEPTLEGRTDAKGNPAKSPRATKSYKEDLKALQESLPDAAYMLSDDNRDLVRAASRSILSHPAVAELHEDAIGREVTMIWEEPSPVPGYPPLLAKARADWLGETWMADLKKFRDPAIRDRFPRQAWTFGYFRQAAWYRRGFRATFGRDLDAFAFAVVCDDPPHEREYLETYKPDLDMADAEIDALLGDLVLCDAAGTFPVGSDETHVLYMEPWMRERIKALTGDLPSPLDV